MKKFILAPYVAVAFLEGDLHFGFGSLKQIITEKKLQECLLDAAVFLKKPRFIDEVNVFLKTKSHDIKYIEKSLKILSTKFLISEHEYAPNDRYSRSLLFYLLSGAANSAEVQTKLLTKKIAIVGCGGIGNIAGVLLATAGIGELLLVDDDHIELSNLSRQIMFKEKDCGRYKTTVLSAALKERSSSIKITEIKKSISSSNIDLLKNSDFILVSADQNNALELINMFGIEHEIPFIGVGYTEDIAVWGPLVIPGKSGCYQCGKYLTSFNKNLNQDQIEKCKIINKGYQAPSNGPINMIAASCAVLDILKFFGNFGQIQSLNTRIGLWSHDLHIEKQDHKIDQTCSVCGKLQKTK